MTALVIIYNHRFDKNIPILEKLYGERFKNIFHLVPFYDGDKENVIPVYEHSFYFQGYVAQAQNFLKKQGDFEHFIFIGDDLLLNPNINESNYAEFFNLNSSTSFLPNYINLSTREDKWARLYDALNFKLHTAGLEVKNEMPTYEQALEKFKEKKLDEPFLIKENLLPSRTKFPKGILGYLTYRTKRKHILNDIRKNGLKLNFPLIGSYSDIFIISNNDMKLFAKYCGVFSASKLFVELAIPTAMVLSCEKIITEDDLPRKGITFWTPDDNSKFLNTYNSSLNDLMTNYPDDVLYFHPVKLSQWK